MDSSNRQGNLIVVSSPSGTGKTTIIHRVLAQAPDIIYSVSYTTRPPRTGEKDGEAYFFIDRSTFKKMMAQEKFYEWAEVYGNYYGTSREFVENKLHKGTDVLLEIDVQGAKSVKKLKSDAVLIFIMPPSFSELVRRLRGRGLDDEAQIRKRLHMALAELKDYDHYDYVVINDDVEKSCFLVRSLIESCRCRIQNNRETIEKIVMTFGDNSYD